MTRRGAQRFPLPGAVLSVLVASAASATSQPPRIPPVVHAPNGEVEFLSADELATDTEAALERLPRESRRQARSALQVADSEEICPEIGPFIFEWLPVAGRDPNLPFRSLDEVIGRAEWILLASVLDRAVGMRWGVPETLMLLEVAEAVRGGVQANTQILAFAPVGALELGQRRVCAVDRGFPPLPEIGDRAVLLLEVPYLSYGVTHLLRGAELVVLPRASKAPRFGPEIAASVPAALRDEGRLLPRLHGRFEPELDDRSTPADDHSSDPR